MAVVRLSKPSKFCFRSGSGFSLISALVSLVSTNAQARSCNDALFQGITAIREVDQTQLFAHLLARDFLPPELRMNSTIQSATLQPNQLWIRDRFPFQVTSAQGLPVVISYLSLFNTYGTAYDGGSSFYEPSIAGPQSIPGARGYRVGDKMKWMEVRSLPILMTGGSVVSSGGYLFIGEKVLTDNRLDYAPLREKLKVSGLRPPQVSSFTDAFLKAGYHARNADETLDEIARVTGIPRDRIVVMPWMPGSRSGSLDSYLATLDDGNLAIPYVPQELIDQLTLPHERDFALRLNTWLDERSRQIQESTSAHPDQAHVVRLPMLPPRQLSQSQLSALGWDATFPSTVDWAVDGHRIFVPAFSDIESEFTAESMKRFRSEIRTKLQAHGFTTVFAEAGELLPKQGLLHAITAKLGFPK